MERQVPPRAPRLLLGVEAKPTEEQIAEGLEQTCVDSLASIKTDLDHLRADARTRHNLLPEIGRHKIVDLLPDPLASMEEEEKQSCLELSSNRALAEKYYAFFVELYARRLAELGWNERNSLAKEACLGMQNRVYLKPEDIPSVILDLEEALAQYKTLMGVLEKPESSDVIRAGFSLLFLLKSRTHLACYSGWRLIISYVPEVPCSHGFRSIDVSSTVLLGILLWRIE